MRERYGFTEPEWRRGKAEMRKILKAEAARRETITYGELSEALSATIQIEPHELAMAVMLGEISGEEDAKGRGMLSALVVHKDGDREPGSGFYGCAAELGRDTSDRTAFWVKELQTVYDYWAIKSKSKDR